METPKTLRSVLHEKLKTEENVDFLKSTFETELKKNLNLFKIAAPMTVLSGTGINDDLNGIERPVSFPVKALNEKRAEVVHSLAKWKRLRLAEYEIPPGYGILTNMNALRPDEDFTPLHSICVDQWDWEKCIPPEQRNLCFLKSTVTKIYKAIKAVEVKASEKLALPEILPKSITFLHSEELLQKYPNLTPKEREDKAAEEFGAIFLIGIGGILSNGEKHDGRAPDYDDWSTRNEDGYTGLNGDILVWNETLGQSLEISSMGIRVDAKALRKQLKISGAESRSQLYFHRKLLQQELPESIGGGIGQSRLCMFLLRKKHIGEVQVGVWNEEMKIRSGEKGIFLL